MTDDPRAQLQQIRERAEAATDGPWSVEPDWAAPGWEEGVTYTRITAGEPNPISGIHAKVFSTDGAMERTPARIQGDRDAHFVALARTDVPRLVDALSAVMDLADAFTEFADQREDATPVSRAAQRRCAQDIRRYMQETNVTEHPARLMSEADLQKSVIELLDLYGWRWHHETDSRKSRAGFPDLIAVHPSGRFLLIELKGYNARGRLGKVTDEQQKWLDAWRRAGARIDGWAITSHTWEPMDWHSGIIARTLRVR